MIAQDVRTGHALRGVTGPSIKHTEEQHADGSPFYHTGEVLLTKRDLGTVPHAPPAPAPVAEAGTAARAMEGPTDDRQMSSRLCSESNGGSLLARGRQLRRGM